jgi:hypothetical protein
VVGHLVYRRHIGWSGIIGALRVVMRMFETKLDQVKNVLDRRGPNSRWLSARPYCHGICRPTDCRHRWDMVDPTLALVECTLALLRACVCLELFMEQDAGVFLRHGVCLVLSTRRS